MSPTLRCTSCGARWHTAARRGRTPATETCLRCGGELAEATEPPPAAAGPAMSLVEELVHAWDSGDIGRALEMCHLEIEITELEALLPGREVRFEGHDGVRRWMELLQEVWDVEFRVEWRERRVLDERSVELVSDLEARSSGEEPDFSTTTRSLWELEDGKIRRVEFSAAPASASGATRA